MRLPVSCALAAAALLFACRGGPQIEPDLSVTYVDRTAPAINRLAILPVRAREGLEGVQRAAAQELHDAIERVWGPGRLVPVEETIQRLNEAELAQRYSSMILTYQETGILDQATLRALAEALEVSHLLHTELALVLNESIRRVNIFAHIWSPEKGDVVWEAEGGAEAKVFRWGGEAPRLQAIVRVAVDRLATSLPRRR